MPTSDGVITTRMLANGAVTAAKIQSLDVGKLTAGSIGVSQWIGSTDYTDDGGAGWRINGDGTAVFNEVTVRGAIYATSGEIEDMTITGTLTTGESGDARIYITGNSARSIHLDTGHDNQTDNGHLYARVSAYEASDALRTVVNSPSLSDNQGDTYLVLETETEDDTTHAPSIQVGYAGESTQTPVFVFNDFELSSYATYATTTANAADVVVTNGGADSRAYTLKRSTSSLAVKDHIKPISDGLDVIRRLQPIRFQSLVDDTDRTFAGFGTEPTIEAFPEADTGGTNYDLRAIVAALVSAVQTLDKETSDG